MLVSKFIEYFLVPLEGELVELVKQNHKVSETTLPKIGLTKINNEEWICQADAGNAGADATEEMAGSTATMNMGEGSVPSSSYSNFEQIVIDKLDYLTTGQRNQHEFCTA